MFANTASGGRPGGAVPGSSRRGDTSQMPPMSGLPSGARGAGAARFTLPSAPFGTPGGSRLGHCADTETERAAIMTAAPVNRRIRSASVTVVARRPPPRTDVDRC